MLNQLALLIPVFLGIALLEWYISAKRGKDYFAVGSTVMNMTLGAIDQIVSLIDFVFLFAVLTFVYDWYHLDGMPQNWVQWVLAYIAVDFVSYWYHRFSHRINILWAGHITHHSADHFNYTNGFRGSPFQGLGRIPFWIVLPLAGFDPVVLVVTLKVSGLYDFWLHTQSIPKLGIFEKVLITPSLHRVHHGKNDVYIDKNYGSTFVIWDKLFGTFQEETVPVEYGIKDEGYVDNSPINAIFYYYRYLFKSAWINRGFITKLKIFLMPPEWKPPLAAVGDKPIKSHKIMNDDRLVKYGYFLMAIGAAGVVVLLLVKDVILLNQFVVLAVILISGLISGARILNKNTREHFLFREWVRNVLCLLLAGILSYLDPSFKIWPLLAALSFSILLLVWVSYPADSEPQIAENI